MPLEAMPLEAMPLEAMPLEAMPLEAMKKSTTDRGIGREFNDNGGIW
jgi:hypothetical protein